MNTIRKLLNGKSGLVTPDGQDVFENKFEYLRKASVAPDQAYREILSTVLHAPGGGGLHICDMRGNPGELGLRASASEDYFGLVYIGDTSSFKKLVEEEASGITLEDDAIRASLFAGINESSTSINILIGAKKFMEGWNSWRVSSMGLLNIGRKEGSEIIQLFGRGVRLQGKDFTLKRSTALEGKHPAHVRLLETLNIFAIRANYMAQFRQYLEREGVETEGDIALPLRIRANDDFMGKGLLIPRVPANRNFSRESYVLLEPNQSSRVQVDMSLKVQALASGAQGLSSLVARSGGTTFVPLESLDFVDWEEAYLQMLEYKEQKGLTNLVIQPDAPRKILTMTEPTRLYTLVADDSVVVPSSFANVTVLQEVAHAILKKYVDKFYRQHEERWDSQNMFYSILEESDPNFQDYTVKIGRSETALIAAVQKLIDEGERVYVKELQELPSIHFDRHLYQPLLIERGDKVRSQPPGLNNSERQFVDDLRAYCQAEKDKSLSKIELFLLRNLTRGKGIGFFEKRGFYPDFILWIKHDQSQRIIFIEPHGMVFAQPYILDDKARLHETLPALAKAMSARAHVSSVSLDSFIVSATPYEDLRNRYDDGTWDRKRFAQAHILFPERTTEYDYLKQVVK